jgi:hypothetical protein
MLSSIPKLGFDSRLPDIGTCIGYDAFLLVNTRFFLLPPVAPPLPPPALVWQPMARLFSFCPPRRVVNS